MSDLIFRRQSTRLASSTKSDKTVFCMVKASLNFDFGS